ncbi:MAG: TerC family protein [Alphaproteobacteria bacterium]|nr:TerC family protein [Alphaproteobacteria bacterium]
MTAAVPVWVWIAFAGLVAVLLAFDLGMLNRGGRPIGMARAVGASAAYAALAGFFALGLWWTLGAGAAVEFATGYAIEWSLSLDNLFVFVLVFAHLGIPPERQHRVLFWGIIGALVMRLVLILLGAGLIARFHWIIYLFGAFLVITGWRMLRAADAEPDLDNNIVLSFARRLLPVTKEATGSEFLLRRDGRWVATPLFLALILVEATDLVFALDSIPAIFAVTRDPFIVFTANAFAVLGLRSLYFALAGLVGRFAYLKYGLSLVLVLVGIKLIVNGALEPDPIPTWAALLATLFLVGGSVALSLARPIALGRVRGWVPFSRAKTPTAPAGEVRPSSPSPPKDAG